MDQESPIEFERIIYTNEEKNYQLRLVVNWFRDKQYIHIRKYFQSYEGEYIASKEGVSMLAEIENIFALLDALIDMCAQAETETSINEYFSNKILALREVVK